MPREWIASKLQIAKRFKVSRGTVDKWVESDWFPKRRKTGWPMDQLVPAIRDHRERVKRDQGPSDDRQRKLSLECDRLEVVIKREEELLKQERLRTQREESKLCPVSEVHAIYNGTLRSLVNCIESLRKNETAKVRNAKEKGRVDRLCDGVRTHLSNELIKFNAKHGGE
jgi:hypothetical protein